MDKSALWFSYSPFYFFFQEASLCSCLVIAGAWYSWRPRWNLDMVMFGLAVRMHQPVYAYERHCISSSVPVSLCSLGNGSGCWVKLVRRCRKLPQGWRGCSFEKEREREKQLDIYRQGESVESFKEVLFPLKAWQFQVALHIYQIMFFVLGTHPLGCILQSIERYDGYLTISRYADLKATFFKTCSCHYITLSLLKLSCCSIEKDLPYVAWLKTVLQQLMG